MDHLPVERGLDLIRADPPQLPGRIHREAATGACRDRNRRLLGLLDLHPLVVAPSHRVPSLPIGILDLDVRPEHVVEIVGLLELFFTLAGLAGRGL